jgi:hypothetical protein
MEQKQLDKVRDAMQQSMTYLKIGGPLLRATASIFCTPIFLVVTIASILPILLLLFSFLLLLAHLWEIAQMTKAAQMHG